MSVKRAVCTSSSIGISFLELTQSFFVKQLNPLLGYPFDNIHFFLQSINSLRAITLEILTQWLIFLIQPPQ